MNTIRPRYLFSDSMSGKVPIHQYETLDELLEVPFVKQRKESPTFLKFSMSRDGLPSRYSLMFEETNGQFWVVGYCSSDVPELPTWNIDECNQRRCEYLLL